MILCFLGPFSLFCCSQAFTSVTCLRHCVIYLHNAHLLASLGHPQNKKLELGPGRVWLVLLLCQEDTVFLSAKTTIPQEYSPNLVLCSLHFTEDCFLIQAPFTAGFLTLNTRLVLKDVAVQF